MATGTATLNFGTAPNGSTHTTVAVTGQTSILANSLVEAFIMPATTADHSVDEHVVEPINVMASTIVAGTGFTINGLYQGAGDNLLYGAWNVGWVWV